jgi:hypothetical protein
LSLDVLRLPAAVDQDAPAELSIDVEVNNFYPAIAAGLSTPVYEATQAFVHVLVTHAFLRSLATLQLEESKVRRFPSSEDASADPSAADGSAAPAPNGSAAGTPAAAVRVDQP